jgi:hypothetical protein
MRSTPRFWYKALLQDRYLVELSIYDVPKSVKYPQAIKYGLICIDTTTKGRVLFDNHQPKGPHLHIDGVERLYRFESEDTLIDDFKQIVLEHLGVKL